MLDDQTQDRGSKKWVALMLPQHVEMIKDWKQEQFHVKKRELTEWELEDIEKTIQQAAIRRKSITLTLWDNHKLKFETGIITGMDYLKKELLIETDTDIKRITLDKIQYVELVDEND